MTDGFGHLPGFFQGAQNVALKQPDLGFVLTFLDLHVLLSVANPWLSFEILVLISFSVSPLVVILEPRYVKSSISSISSPFSMMAASVLLFILKCFVFLVLIFSPISLAFLVMSSILACIYRCRCESSAISSAKSKSSRTLVRVHRIPLLFPFITLFMTQSIPRRKRKGESILDRVLPRW